MSRDSQYILEQFKGNSVISTKNNIVLYGIGKNTKMILDNIDNCYNIVGLMDAETVGQTMWGYKVLSEEEVIERKVDVIVIVARKSVHNIIYKRIAEFTTKNNITVVDVAGNIIQMADDNIAHIGITPVTKTALLNKLSEYNVISFDLFDTIFQRNLLYPGDLLRIMSKEVEKDLDFDFYQTRIWAETECKKEKYPTIYEIYKMIQKKEKIDDELAKKLLEYEIEKEEKCISARMDMVEILNWCVESGKKVFIVSDMYIPRKILEKWLDKCGVKGLQDIYVSCEYGVSKKNGLYEIFKADCAERILHIGDNDVSDIEMAQKSGLDTFKIMSGYEMLSNSRYKKLLDYTTKLSDRVIIGMFVKYIFSSPFALTSEGKAAINDSDVFAKIFLAPLVYFYTMKVYEEAKQGVYDIVLFVSRDGCLPKRIFHLFEKGNGYIPNIYFYISGRAVSVANINKIEDLELVLDEYRGTLQQFFEEFLNMPMPDSIGVESDRIMSNAFENHVTILESTSGEKTNYIKYIKDCGIEDNEKILYCDIFSKGTGQFFLEQLLGKTIKGIYLQKTPSGISGKDSIAYTSLFKEESRYMTDLNIIKYYSLIEYFLSSTEPCFLGISKEKRVLFYPEERGVDKVSLIDNIHNSIYEYCLEILEICKGNIQDVSLDIIDIVMGYLDQVYTDINVPELDNLETYEWSRGAKKIVGKISGCK